MVFNCSDIYCRLTRSVTIVCFDGAKLLLFCETAVTLFAGKVALSGEKHFSVALPSFITPPLDREKSER